jgi:crotonobetainyl-CoA:carnitine CoA-transferase CaiB-like acyl-CoA transferase
VTDAGWRTLLEQAWEAVSGEAALPAEFTVTGPPSDELPSTLPVADAALACTGAALLAAAALSGQTRSVALDARQVAAAVRGEGYLRVGGKRLGPGFAPLSRFWQTADGWVRTHGNYPWHRRALLAALDISADSAGTAAARTAPGAADDAAGGADDAGAAADDGAAAVHLVAAAMAELPALEAERRVAAAGGVAAALRTPEQWLAHPHGHLVAQQPLIADTWFDTAAGGPIRKAGRGAAPKAGRDGPPKADGPLPAAGIRVLDLTRVIAGPVATRYLAALGADVLRLDPPDRPELPLHRYDGLIGKRSALLDAASPDGAAQLHELLDSADVLVLGYRPGALSRFGLGASALAERHPGLVVIALSAWGRHGPWGGRRGFDSIVQAASGIADRESPDGERPGALPCQLLDHGTGYLCAAAALDGLRRRSHSGGTWLRELSLARTAHWLLGQPATERIAADQPRDVDAGWLTELPSEPGPVTTVNPPGALDGVGLRWPDLPVRYGVAPPTWET